MSDPGLPSNGPIVGVDPSHPRLLPRWLWVTGVLLAVGTGVGFACFGDPSSGDSSGSRPVLPDDAGADTTVVEEPGCPESAPRPGTLCPETSLSRLDCPFLTDTCLYQGARYDEVTTFCCLAGETWDVCEQTTTPCESDPEGGSGSSPPVSPDAGARGDAGDAGDAGDGGRDAPSSD